MGVMLRMRVCGLRNIVFVPFQNASASAINEARLPALKTVSFAISLDKTLGRCCTGVQELSLAGKLLRVFCHHCQAWWDLSWVDAASYTFWVLKAFYI